MIDRVFLAHPRSVGENYREHAAVAGSFGLRMVTGGLACMVHAAVPTLFATTASATVKHLYAQMRSRQPAFAKTPPAFSGPEWQLEYEI